MAKQEKNEKFIKEFGLRKKALDKEISNIKAIKNPISDFLKALSEYGKGIQDDTKSYLKNALNEIDNKISESNDTTEIIHFLSEVKIYYTKQFLKAKIDKNGYLQKDIEAAIKEIIEPLLKEYIEKKETENKLSISQIIHKTHLPKKDIKYKESIDDIKFEKQNKVEVNNKEKTLPLPKDFEQIICDGNEKEILEDLMTLAKTRNSLNNDFYMTEPDVLEFAKKNFSIFNSTPTGRYFNINLFPKQKKILMYFIYQFTVKYNRKTKIPKLKYAKLLIHNFEVFKHDKPEVLVTNISESKKPSSPTNIITIPKRNQTKES